MASRILIIDDEVVLARWLERSLSKSFEVVTVFGGQEGLDAWIEKGPFDVVLCDLMMPVITGLHIHRKLQQLSPGSERRIVFMTGGAYTQATETFLASIENPRLEKPFDTKSVLESVEQIVRKFA